MVEGNFGRSVLPLVEGHLDWVNCHRFPLFLTTTTTKSKCRTWRVGIDFQKVTPLRGGVLDEISTLGHHLFGLRTTEDSVYYWFPFFTGDRDLCFVWSPGNEETNSFDHFSRGKLNLFGNECSPRIDKGFSTFTGQVPFSSQKKHESKYFSS